MAAGKVGINVPNCADRGAWPADARQRSGPHPCSASWGGTPRGTATGFAAISEKRAHRERAPRHPRACVARRPQRKERTRTLTGSAQKVPRRSYFDITAGRPQSQGSVRTDSRVVDNLRSSICCDR
eukprot:COSAG02_NODE_4921_length_4836_cov_2.655478_2_plen_126_part_00